MIRAERQIPSNEINGGWKTNPEAKKLLSEVDIACTGAFQKVNNLWLKFLPYIPGDYDHNSQLEVNTPYGTLSLSPRDAQRHRLPRIRDAEIPDNLKLFFERYAAKKKMGRNTRIPGVNFMEACLKLYREWPVDKSKDSYGIIPLEQEYEDWMGSFWLDWLVRETEAVGWTASIDSDHDQKSSWFKFSKNGGLIGFSSISQHPIIGSFNASNKDIQNYPTLCANASFKKDKLYSLYYDAPNGVFFPDPKGNIDSIWPQWIKKRNDKTNRSNNTLATEEDWELYLERIRSEKLVYSPLTRKYVHQTEKQAKRNLEKSRSWIYYHIPQGFHFFKTPYEPGFDSELGYSLPSKFRGRFIPKKTKDKRSYVKPSKDQSLYLLSSWNP